MSSDKMLDAQEHRHKMILFSKSRMTSDLAHWELQEVFLSRVNEMGFSLWDELDHPRATTY
jgi:hypothetical protein